MFFVYVVGEKFLDFFFLAKKSICSMEKYGEISNWDVSKVTNTRMLHLFKKIRAVVADHAPWYHDEESDSE